MGKEQYRHELKYQIEYADYLGMRSRLKRVMRVDPHAGAEGIYRVHSIYFDNYRDRALREKIQGLAEREKFRIRFYNEDRSYFVLEKKQKRDSLCRKTGVVLDARTSVRAGAGTVCPDAGSGVKTAGHGIVRQRGVSL